MEVHVEIKIKQGSMFKPRVQKIEIKDGKLILTQEGKRETRIPLKKIVSMEVY